MSDDNECVKCGRYSGGSTLCLMCQRSAVKKNAKKPRKKKADPVVKEMILMLKRIRSEAGMVVGIYDVDGELEQLIARAEASFR